MSNNPKEAWQIANALQKSMAEGEHGLAAVPKLVVKVVSEELWREIYCEPIKQTVKFKSFVEFVTSGLPEGLGATVRLLKNLCADNPAALDAIDMATANQPGNATGNNQHGTVDIVNISTSSRPTGNSHDAALRRLRKDRPDLHKRVIDGEISAHGAMVEAGFRKRPDPLNELQRWWKKATAEQQREFLKAVGK